MKLADHGYGMTLLPYLASLDINPELVSNIKPIAEPRPTREVSVVYRRTQLKIGLVEALAKAIKESIPKKLLSKNENVIAPL